MQILFNCTCGTKLQAAGESQGKLTKCPKCGSLVSVPRQFDESFPVSSLGKSPTQGIVEWKLWFALAAVLVAVVIGMFAVFNKHLKDTANLEVAEKVKVAKEAMSQHKWDEAIEVLEQSVATSNATELDEANGCLAAARDAKVKHVADQLLVSVEKSIDGSNITESMRLLRKYLGDPNSTGIEKANQLLIQIELATSGEQAVKVLIQLPDDTFEQFKAGGSLACLDQVENNSLRVLYRKTLCSALPEALRFRDEARRRRETDRLASADRRRAEMEAEARKQQAGKIIRRFSGLTQGCVSLALSRDGRYVVAASYDDTIRIWNAKTGEQRYNFQPPAKDPTINSLTSVAISSDGRHAVAAREDGTIHLWEVETGQEVNVLEGVEIALVLPIVPNARLSRPMAGYS